MRCSSRRFVMYDLAGENELDLETLRARLRRMSDRELIRFGRARYVCSSAANHDGGPCRVFVIQLREAENEWLRRHLEGAAPACSA